MKDVQMSDPSDHVAFERDEGQEYGVGARVTVHAMNSAYRTLAPNPTHGDYQVTRCERIRDVGWKALRISLRPVSLRDLSGPVSMTIVDSHP